MSEDTVTPQPLQEQDPVKAEHMAYAAAHLMDLSQAKQAEHAELVSDPKKVVDYDQTQKGHIFERKGRPIRAVEVAPDIEDKALGLKKSALEKADEEGNRYDYVKLKEPEQLPHLEATFGVKPDEYEGLELWQRVILLSAVETRRSYAKDTLAIVAGKTSIEDLTPEDFEALERQSIHAYGSVREGYSRNDPQEIMRIRAEIRANHIKDSADRAIEHCVNLIDSRYGPEQDDDYLTFHGSDHTRNVVRRVGVIAEALLTSQDISKSQAQLARVAAAFHDVVQNSTIEPDPSDPAILKRKRATGENENLSADEAVNFMVQENARLAEERGEEDYYLFTAQDVAVVREAIKATTPGWDPEAQTVVQPHLKDAVSKVSYILALADIGNVGIDGKEAAVRDNDQLFLEENVDVLRAIQDGNIDAEKQQWYKDRLNGSLASQIKFIEGRQKLFNGEVGIFSSWSQRLLTEEVFTKFDEAIAEAKARLAARSKMPPSEVVQDLVATAGITTQS